MAMGLTVLGLIGGFAAASLTAPVSSSEQNGFAFSAPSNTIYATSTPWDSLVFTTASACTANGGDVETTSTTAYVFITGPVTCQTASSDFFEEYTFPGTLNAGSATDLFSITYGPLPPINVTVSYSGLAAHDAVTTNIYVEIGSTASELPCAVVVSGS